MQFISNSSIIYHRSSTNGSRNQHYRESKVGTKKGEKGEKTETVKVHNAAPGSNIRKKEERRKRKGGTKRIIMYTWLEAKS